MGNAESESKSKPKPKPKLKSGMGDEGQVRSGQDRCAGAARMHNQNQAPFIRPRLCRDQKTIRALSHSTTISAL